MINNKPVLKNYTKTQAGQREIPIPLSLKVVLEALRTTLKGEMSLYGSTMTGDTPVFATAEGKYTHPDNMSRALQCVLDWADPKPQTRKNRNGTTSILTLEERMRGVAVNFRARLEAVVLSGDALPKISPHDLRHTCGTLWLRKDVRLEVVSKWLGHADIGVTLKVYRHVLPSETRAFRVDFFAEPSPTRVIAEVPLN